MTIKEAYALATPLPWNPDWREGPNECGTTCAEANANSRIERHAVNMLPEVLEALDELRACFVVDHHRNIAMYARPAEFIADKLRDTDAIIAKASEVKDST